MPKNIPRKDTKKGYQGRIPKDEGSVAEGSTGECFDGRYSTDPSGKDTKE
jgi:hypothetical protein